MLWLISSELFDFHSHLVHLSWCLWIFVFKYNCVHCLDHLLNVVQTFLLLLRKIKLWLFKLCFKVISEKINMMSQVINVRSVFLYVIKYFIRVVDEIEMIFDIDHLNLLNATDFSNLFNLVVQKVILMLSALIKISFDLILSLNHLLLQSWNITLKLLILLVKISLYRTFILFQ